MNRLFSLVILAPLLAVSAPSDAPKPQYQHGDILIAAASAAEPLRKEFSLELAANYVKQGATAWAGQRKCVSCHTVGSYLQAAPALTSHLGKPSDKMREFYLAELAEIKSSPREKFKRGTITAQTIYVAAGLAEWDRHITGKLSPATREALDFMFEIQQDNGTWQSLDCWPPLESSAYQEATVAAMAAATAPGWLQEKHPGFQKLLHYLREEPPPHDYGRVLLLWTATRIPVLLTRNQHREFKQLIFDQQHDDGGWSIRDFAKPEEWGGGNRAKKLKREPEYKNPPSDGHMTGLCALVLLEAGVPADHPRIRQATDWLLKNQRESGRWWTRSLNTDKYHFITYSGTMYPLLALAKAGRL